MTDRLLVERAQAGDHAAFMALVARHRRMVQGLCYRIAGQAGEAEALAHDAFVEAWLKLAQVRDGERVGGWLRTVALNVCRMWLRGRPDFDELSEALPAEAPTEDDGRMGAALARLSPEHRLALVLHHVEGLPYAEVAEFLGVPVGTVMSRLHRGRAALKRSLEDVSEEEIPMNPDAEFSRDVDAEIAVLVRIFRDDRAAAERLSVVLARSPERLARLIDETDDEDLAADLGVLLWRLGRPAIEVTVAAALGEDAEVRGRATHVLRRFVAEAARESLGGVSWTHTPPTSIFLMVDAMLRSTAPERRKAALLVALLAVSPGRSVDALLTSVLLAMPAAALEELRARFWAATDVADLFATPQVPAAAARLGTAFLRDMPAALAGDDPRRVSLALAGMEAFGQCWEARHWEASRVTPAFTRRHAGRWAPIREDWLDQSVIDEAAARVVELAGSTDADLRRRVLRVLGLMERRKDLPVVLAALHSDDAGTRRAAIQAIADMGADEAAPALVERAGDHAADVRMAAVTALGRLGVDAVPVAVHLLDDPSAQVRQAAVNALGDMGGDDAKAALEAATRSQDRALMQAAAKVLCTSPHFRKRREPNVRLQELTREVRSRLHGDVQYGPGGFSLSDAIATLPDPNGSYPERELNRHFLRAVHDYATTRRQMVMDGLMTREAGVYTLTDAGKAMWRVERFVQE